MHTAGRRLLFGTSSTRPQEQCAGLRVESRHVPWSWPAMKLVTFADDRGMRIGALTDDRAIVDFSAAAPSLPQSMTEFIRLGREGIAAAAAAIASSKARTPAQQVTLCAPIPRPARNILCVG